MRRKATKRSPNTALSGEDVIRVWQAALSELQSFMESLQGKGRQKRVIVFGDPRTMRPKKRR